MTESGGIGIPVSFLLNRNRLDVQSSIEVAARRFRHVGGKSRAAKGAKPWCSRAKDPLEESDRSCLRRKPERVPRKMDSIFDVEGASGRSYRFTKVDNLGPTPNGSGNFLLISANNNLSVIGSGTALDLYSAVEYWKTLQLKDEESKLYLRLNVTNLMRQAEHEDICLKHHPKIVAPEIDS